MYYFGLKPPSREGGGCGIREDVLSLEINWTELFTDLIAQMGRIISAII